MEALVFRGSGNETKVLSAAGKTGRGGLLPPDNLSQREKAVLESGRLSDRLIHMTRQRVITLIVLFLLIFSAVGVWRLAPSPAGVSTVFYRLGQKDFRGALDRLSEDVADGALTDAQVYADRGKFEKSLERHVWYHENALKYQPSLYGVRLSFALGDWGELGKSYPPAIDKMIEIRDESYDRFVNHNGPESLFHDVCSINEQLGTESLTIQLFAQLAESNPKKARQAFRFVDDLLIVENRFGLFSQFGDSKSHLKQVIASRRDMLSHFAKHPYPSSSEMIDRENEALVETVLKLAAMAVEKGDLALAKDLKAMAHKEVPDARLTAGEPELP